MLRGLEVKEAENQLKFLIKGSAPDFEKLLKSAIANAENNFGLDKDNLFVKDIIVNEGARLKRWLPRAYGRATLILKRTSNVGMVLAEKVEGKGRKKIEKRKEIRDIRHEEIERKEERGEEEVQEEKKPARLATRSVAGGEITKKKDEKGFLDEKKKSAGARGFLKRIFRRKSM